MISTHLVTRKDVTMTRTEECEMAMIPIIAEYGIVRVLVVCAGNLPDEPLGARVNLARCLDQLFKIDKIDIKAE